MRIVETCLLGWSGGVRKEREGGSRLTEDYAGAVGTLSAVDGGEDGAIWVETVVSVSGGYWAMLPRTSFGCEAARHRICRPAVVRRSSCLWENVVWSGSS